jgi:SAM-dependent methyltransferase
MLARTKEAERVSMDFTGFIHAVIEAGCLCSVNEIGLFKLPDMNAGYGLYEISNNTQVYQRPLEFLLNVLTGTDLVQKQSHKRYIILPGTRIDFLKQIWEIVEQIWYAWKDGRLFDVLEETSLAACITGCKEYLSGIKRLRGSIADNMYSSSILSLLEKLLHTRIIQIGMHINLFKELLQRKMTANALSVQLNAEKNVLSDITEILTEIDYIEINDYIGINSGDQAISLTKKAKEYLEAIGGAAFHKYYMNMLQTIFTITSRLGFTLKKNLPATGYQVDKEQTELYYLSLANVRIYNFKVNLPFYNTIANIIEKIKKREVENILDIGSGTGGMSIPLLKRNSAGRLTLIDFPQILELSSQYMEILKLNDRCEFLAGNALTLSIPAERYDLVIVSEMFQGWNGKETMALLEKINNSLKPEGIILLIERYIDKEGITPFINVLFQINLLLTSLKGRLRQDEEYEVMFTGTGFKTIYKNVIGTFLIMVAEKTEAKGVSIAK